MFNTNCYGNESIPSYTQGVETPWPSHTTHSNQNIFQHPVTSNPNAFVGYGLGQVQSKELDLAGVVGMKENSGTTSTPASSNAWHHSHRMRYSSTAGTTRGFLPYQMSSLPHYDSQSVDTSHLTHGTHHQFWMTNPNAAYTLMHNYNQRDHNTYSERGDTSRNTATIRHNTSMPNRNYSVEDQSRNVNTTVQPQQQQQQQQQSGEALSQHCQRQSRQQIHQLQQHQQMHHQQDFLRNQLSQRDREPCQYTNSNYHQESMRVGVDPTLYHDQHVMPTTQQQQQQQQHQQYQASQEALRKAESERRTAFTSRQTWSQAWAKPAYVPFDTSQAFLSTHRSTGSAFQPCSKQAGTDPYSMDSIWAKSAVPTAASHVAHATSHSIPSTNNHIPMPTQTWLHDTTSHLKPNVYRPPQEINPVTNLPSNFSTNVLNLDTGQVEMSMSVLPPDLSLYSQTVPQTQRHRTSTSHPLPVPVQPRHCPLPTSVVPQNQMKPVVKEAPPKPVELSRPTSTARAAGLDVRQFLATWDEDADIATPRPAVTEIDEPEPLEPSSTTSLVVLDYQNVPSEEAAGLLQMYPGLQLSGNDPVVLLDNTTTKTNLDFVLSRAVPTTTSTETASGTRSDDRVNQYSSAIDVQPTAIGCARAPSPAIPEKTSNSNHIEEIPCESNKHANVELKQVELGSQPRSQEVVTPVSACESDSERNKKSSLRHFRKRKAVSTESDASSQYSEHTDEVPTKCMKTDNDLSNWFGNDSMDSIDGPIRTPVSVSSGACDRSSSTVQSPVDSQKASEEEKAEAPNTFESTPVSVITMNRNAREEMGRSMPDIFNDEMDQETSKNVEAEHREVIDMSRESDYAKEYNEVISELREIKSREPFEKSKKQQASDEDLNSSDCGFRESCDGAEQESPEMRRGRPDVELEIDNGLQQSSKIAGEEPFIDKPGPFRKTYEDTIFAENENSGSPDRALYEKSDHQSGEKRKRETCEKPDHKLSIMLDGHRDDSDPEPADLSNRPHNEVTIKDPFDHNVSDCEHREPSNLTNQRVGNLINQDDSVDQETSDSLVNQESCVVMNREPGHTIWESADLTRELDKFADRGQDDSFQDHIPDNFNSNTMNSSLQYCNDPSNQKSGDPSYQNSDNLEKPVVGGPDSEEHNDLPSCKRSRGEHLKLIARQTDDLVDPNERDCKSRDSGECGNLHPLESTLQVISDPENRIPSDSVSGIISESRVQNPTEHGNPKTFSSKDEEFNDLRIAEARDEINPEPSNLHNVEPSERESPKTSDIFSVELCDDMNQNSSDRENRMVCDLEDQKNSDVETGGIRNEETGDFGDREPCHVGDQETGDRGHQETGDMSSQKVGDVVGRKTVDILYRGFGDTEGRKIGDQEICVVVGPQTNDHVNQETSDMGDRKTCNFGNQATCHIQEQETGVVEVRDTGDKDGETLVFGNRGTGDTEEQETGNIGNREAGSDRNQVSDDIRTRKICDSGNQETSDFVTLDLGNREGLDSVEGEPEKLGDRETEDFEDLDPRDSESRQPNDWEYEAIDFSDSKNPEPKDNEIKDPGDSIYTDDSVNFSAEESNHEPPDNIQEGVLQRFESKADTEPSIDSSPLQPDTKFSGAHENEEKVTSIAKIVPTRAASGGRLGTTKYLSRIVRSAPGKIPKILLSRLKDVRVKSRRNHGVKKLPSIRLTRVQTNSSVSANKPPEYICREGEFQSKCKEDGEELPVPETKKRRKEEGRKIDSSEQLYDSNVNFLCTEDTGLQSIHKNTPFVPVESSEFSKQIEESSAISPDNANIYERVIDIECVENSCTSVSQSCHSPRDEDWVSVFGQTPEHSDIDSTTNLANDAPDKDVISRPVSPFEKRMSSGQLLRNKSPDASAILYQDFTRLRPIRRRPIPKRRFSFPSPKSFEEDVPSAQTTFNESEREVSTNVFKFALQPIRTHSVSFDGSAGPKVNKTTFEMNKEQDTSEVALLDKIRENRKENSWSSEEDSSDISRERYKKSPDISKGAQELVSGEQFLVCSTNDASITSGPGEVISRRSSEGSSINSSHESHNSPTRYEASRKSSSKERDSFSSDVDNESTDSSSSDSLDADAPIEDIWDEEKDKLIAEEENYDNITDDIRDDIARPAEDSSSNQKEYKYVRSPENEIEEGKCLLESLCSDAEAVAPLDNSKSVLDILVANVSSEPNLEKADDFLTATSSVQAIGPLVKLRNADGNNDSNMDGVIDSLKSDIPEPYRNVDACRVSAKVHEEVILGDLHQKDNACLALDPIDPGLSLSSKEIPCLDSVLSSEDMSDHNEKTDMTKSMNHSNIVDDTEVVVGEDTLLVFTDGAGVFVDGEDGCERVEVQDENADEFHIVVDEEQYEGLCNGTMEVRSDEALKTFTVENVQKTKEQIRDGDVKEVHRDQGDYYCDEIGSAPVEEVVNSETACDIEEVLSSCREDDVNPIDVVPVPLESVRNRPLVRKMSEEEDIHLSRKDILLEVKCSLSWDRILNEGQGLVLGPANVEVRVPGEHPKENTHWKVVTRERKRPGSSRSRSCVEENNNFMPDVKSPIVVVKSLVLKRPRTKRFRHQQEEQDTLEDLLKDSAKTLPRLKTKGALKAFQAQTEVTHIRNRNRSWPNASRNSNWKRGLKRRRSDWSPPAQDYTCPSPQRLPKVIIKKKGPRYQSYICEDDVFMQPVVTIERNAELDNLALNMWSEITSPSPSGGESLKDDRLTRTKETELNNSIQLNGSVHHRKRSQSSDGRPGQLMKVVELLQQWRQAEQEAACKRSIQSECGDTKDNNNSLLCVDNNADDERYLHRCRSSDTSSSVISSPEGSITNACSCSGISVVDADEKPSSCPEVEDKEHGECGDIESRLHNLEDSIVKRDVHEDNAVKDTVPEKPFLGVNVKEDRNVKDVLEDNIVEKDILRNTIVEEDVQEENIVQDIVEDIAGELHVQGDRVQGDTNKQQDVQREEFDDGNAQVDDITNDTIVVEKVAEDETVVQEGIVEDTISKSISNNNNNNMSQTDVVKKIAGDIVQEYDDIGEVITSTLQEADSVLQDTTVQVTDKAFEENRISETVSAFQEKVVVREADSVLQEDAYQPDVQVSCTEKADLGDNTVSPEHSRRTSIDDVLGSPLVCQVCGFTTTSLEEHANHIRTHSYHCQRCQLAFLSHENFKDHLAAEHPTIEELHHCLLCQRTFPTAERHSQHKKVKYHHVWSQGWHHSQMERSQRHTIHSLYRYFTGNECPYLPSLAPEESVAFDWLPSDPGVIHFYHDATPLQLAIQDCEGAKGDTEACE